MELRPQVEQIVIDERGRRTFLSLPGFIAQGRAFVAAGGSVATELDRYLDEQLASIGGAVLLRDVPASVYARWQYGWPIGRHYADLYLQNVAAYIADERKQAMAKQAVKKDSTRMTTKLWGLIEQIAEVEISLGRENKITELFKSAAQRDTAVAKYDELAAERDQAIAEREEARKTSRRRKTLMKHLNTAINAGDLAAIKAINEQLKALGD